MSHLLLMSDVQGEGLSLKCYLLRVLKDKYLNIKLIKRINKHTFKIYLIYVGLDLLLSLFRLLEKDPYSLLTYYFFKCVLSFCLSSLFIGL